MDVPEAHHRLALRQLPRGLGGQLAGRQGQDPPTLSKVYSLEETGQAVRTDVHRNLHQGKVALALAPREGLGVRDEAKRAQHIDAINRFRNVSRSPDD